MALKGIGRTGNKGLKMPTGGGSAVVEWGPDFGEPNGADGVTWRAVAAVDLAAVDVENTKTVGVNLDLASVDIENTKTTGVHLSGSVLGAPFWQSVATTALTNAASSITVASPAGLQVGDLMIVLIGVAATLTTPTINTEPGWTLIRSITGGTTHQHSRSFRKIATAGDIAGPHIFNFSAVAQQATAELHRIIGTDGTTPINASATASGIVGITNPADPPAPAVTTTVTNCLVFAWLFHSHLALPQAHTPPALHIETVDIESTVAAVIYSSTSAWRVFALAGDTLTAIFNCSETVNTDWQCHRIAIAPGELIIAP